MTSNNNENMTLNEYAKIWGTATLMQLGFSIVIVLATAKPHFFLLMFIPSILIPIWMAINAARSQIKNFAQKRKINNNPLLALMTTLDEVYHLLPNGEAQEKCLEIRNTIDALRKFSTNELPGELLVFVESARTILVEYKNKAIVLSKIDDEKSDEIGIKVIIQIHNNLNTLVDDWVDDTTDDLKTSIASWSETISSVNCLTPEEEQELNAAMEEMEQENV